MRSPPHEAVHPEATTGARLRGLTHAGITWTELLAQWLWQPLKRGIEELLRNGVPAPAPVDFGAGRQFPAVGSLDVGSPDVPDTDPSFLATARAVAADRHGTHRPS